MNGAAHIMNDEATRKYLQAMKRVLTFVQRVHPTDPSRSVDFDAFRDAGRGAAGMGSDKLVSPSCQIQHPSRPADMQASKLLSTSCCQIHTLLEHILPEPMVMKAEHKHDFAAGSTSLRVTG